MNTSGKHLPDNPSRSNQSVLFEATVEQQHIRHNLLSIPTEVRVLIYEYAFEDEAFIVDVPVHAPLQLRYGGQLRMISNEQKRSLPGVLQLCKQVRTEALPLYSETIHPLFCNHKAVIPRQPIPDHYLSHVKKLYVAGRSTAYPPVHRMPDLETVVLQCRSNEHPHLHIKAALMSLDVHELLWRNSLGWSEYAKAYWRLCRQARATMRRDSSIRLLLNVFVESRSEHKCVVSMLLRLNMRLC